MLHKTFEAVEFKAASGRGTALFAAYNAVDKDGDVTLEGAFEDGAPIIVSAWQHTSWQTALPVGKGRIRTSRKGAMADIEFFDTPTGREHAETVHQLGRMCQWSYGFDIVDSERGKFQGRGVRFLKKMLVHEVSPVLVGAGVGTRTEYSEVGSTIDVDRELARFLRGQATTREREELEAIRLGAEMSQIRQAL
jgi:hypothetical protein